MCQRQRENTVSGNSWDVPPSPRPNLDTQKKPPLPAETQAFSPRPPSGRAADATAAPGRPRPPPPRPSGLGSDAARPAPAARSAAAAAAGRPAGGGGGLGREKMADGVDHIDIYADVGEEFNQVREGPGPRRQSGRRCGPDADPGSAAGCEPARLQTVRPCRLWAAPSDPGGAPPSPLVLPRRFAGRGCCCPPQGLERGRGPPCRRRRPLPRRRHLPIVGGGRRALPAALGPGGGAACAPRGERAAAAPPPPPPGRGGSPAGRAPGAACSPTLQLGLRFLSSLHFVSPAAHGRLMEGRIHGPLYPARPVSWAPARVCDRFRRGAFFLLSSHFVKAASVWARLQQVL